MLNGCYGCIAMVTLAFNPSDIFLMQFIIVFLVTLLTSLSPRLNQEWVSKIFFTDHWMINT